MNFDAFAAPTVRNIATKTPAWPVNGIDIYIGRNPGLAKDCGMKSNLWANPFRVPTNGKTADEVIGAYENWTRGRLGLSLTSTAYIAMMFAAAFLPRGHFRDSTFSSLPVGQLLRAEILALGGKTLWCHCAPKPCHGDVLVKLWNELRAVPG